MIDLYFWPTANGIKIPLLLEELGVAFRPFLLNIRAGEHKTEVFRQLNPNGKIPVIVDHAPANGDGPLVVFESAAILIYLAEKHGRFLAGDLKGKYAALEWLFWHSAHLIPALGQYQKFREQIPVQATDPLLQAAQDDVARVYQVLDAHLAGSEYLAGEYSIADIAIYPWIQPHRQGQSLIHYPNLARWYDSIRARPAVTRAYAQGLKDAPAEKSLADWRN